MNADEQLNDLQSKLNEICGALNSGEYDQAMRLSGQMNTLLDRLSGRIRHLRRLKRAADEEEKG